MAIAAPSEGSAHFVQFYEGDDFLHAVVADFLDAGIRAREQLVVIATESTRRGLDLRLSAEGHDLDRLRATGQLTVLDARATLARIMVRGTPDLQAFDAEVGAAIARAAAARPATRIRAFGEMVDVLCREGELGAALELEELWSDLAEEQSLCLLCGYSLASFQQPGPDEGFRRVCEAHAQVMPTEAWHDDDAPEAKRRAVAALQHRVRALEAELERTRLAAGLVESPG